MFDKTELPPAKQNGQNGQRYDIEMYKSEYTEFYQSSDNDSPAESREYLIERLLFYIKEELKEKDKITILDLGAGKQILELELHKRPEFQNVLDKVTIITLDIAILKKSQLLWKKGIAVQADGTHLPFVSNYFDIVISNMAIDFMPKEEAFAELKRVVRPEGKILINFHHPNLIRIAQLSRPDLMRDLRSAKQKIKFARHSKKITEYQKKLNELQNSLRDIEFILKEFPQIIFFTVDEIIKFLNGIFMQEEVSIVVDEHKGETGKNGWFSVELIKLVESCAKNSTG